MPLSNPVTFVPCQGLIIIVRLKDSPLCDSEVETGWNLHHGIKLCRSLYLYRYRIIECDFKSCAGGPSIDVCRGSMSYNTEGRRAGLPITC